MRPVEQQVIARTDQRCRAIEAAAFASKTPGTPSARLLRQAFIKEGT